MHWNVPLDALPVSARLVLVLDRWRNDCMLVVQNEKGVYANYWLEFN